MNRHDLRSGRSGSRSSNLYIIFSIGSNNVLRVAGGGMERLVCSSCGHCAVVDDRREGIDDRQGRVLPVRSRLLDLLRRGMKVRMCFGGDREFAVPKCGEAFRLRQDVLGRGRDTVGG